MDILQKGQRKFYNGMALTGLAWSPANPISRAGISTGLENDFIPAACATACCAASPAPHLASPATGLHRWPASSMTPPCQLARSLDKLLAPGAACWVRYAVPPPSLAKAQWLVSSNVWSLRKGWAGRPMTKMPGNAAMSLPGSCTTPISVSALTSPACNSSAQIQSALMSPRLPRTTLRDVQALILPVL